MSNWASGILTAAGRILQAKVEAGETLELTKLQLGDGLETKADIDAMIKLSSPREDIKITGTSAENGVCKVSGIISSKNVETGFYARELGLFAKDPDLGEVLYMLSIDSEPDFVPPKSLNALVTAEYTMNIAVASVDNFVVDIDSDGLATLRQIKAEARCVMRDTAYKIGDILYDTRLRPGYFLECITAGTTSENDVVLNRLKVNDTVNDGEVVWRVCQMKVSQGDVFEETESGIVIGNLAESVRAVEFFRHPDGSITIAPERFTSTRFIRNQKGGIVVAQIYDQADIDTDDDDPDNNPSEKDIPVATKDDIAQIIAKFN